MKRILTTLALCLSSMPQGNAGTPDDSAKESQDGANAMMQAGRWRFGASFAPMMNIDTEFSGLGGFVNPLSAAPIAPGTTYNYDDGFVGVDVSSNAGGETWNWGYENASQYDPTGGGSINYSISNSAADARASDNDETAPGIDLFAYYDMGVAVMPFDLRAMKPRWGLRFGIHAAGADFENRSTLQSGVTSTRDRFSMNGTIPPVAPYTGLFDPGIAGAPLLSDTPTRDTVTTANGASISGSRDLDLFLTTFSVGSYLEFPVYERFNLFLEGGVNLAIAHGDYSQVSNTSIPGAGVMQTTGSAEETDLLLGIYLGTSLSYRLTNDFSLFSSIRYQLLEEFEVSAGNSTAETSFGGALILSLGGMYHF